jgi:hypothetical protein
MQNQDHDASHSKTGIFAQEAFWPIRIDAAFLPVRANIAERMRCVAC